MKIHPPTHTINIFSLKIKVKRVEVLCISVYTLSSAWMKVYLSFGKAPYTTASWPLFLSHCGFLSPPLPPDPKELRAPAGRPAVTK